MGTKFGAFLAGGLAGAAIALLYAPRPGEETRAIVTDKMSTAWSDVQEKGIQAAENVQQVYQEATIKGQQFAKEAQEKGQQFAKEAQEKGQEFRTQATARVQEAAGTIKPAFSQKNDDLRDKIEAARQRIAAQVARNTGESQEQGSVSDAISASFDVAGDVDDSNELVIEPSDSQESKDF